MLIIALVLAIIGLAALVTAVVTSNELIAWVCIGASVLGVLLLIIDAVRDRTRRGTAESHESDEPQDAPPAGDFDADYADYADYPDDAATDADVFDEPAPADEPIPAEEVSTDESAGEDTADDRGSR